MNDLCGWCPDGRAVDEYCATLRRPIFGTSAFELCESGSGKIVLLYELLRSVANGFPARVQTIGDCVSQAFALAVDLLAAAEIVRGDAERWISETATEAIYGAARVEIGRGRLSGDGAVGAWAARAVSEIGTLRRMRYGRSKNLDLTMYDGSRARRWGKRGAGLPDSLEPTAREHLVRSVSQIGSYDEARDAIANYYPVVVCSKQGFAKRRDAEGFCKPSGNWSHAMCFAGVNDNPRRPALLVVNSWPKSTVSGPKTFNQPPVSWWVDADVCDRMFRQMRDSWTLSQFEGYRQQTLGYELI